MSPNAVSPRKAACDHVYAAFPEMRGARPTVRQNGPTRTFIFAKTLGAGGSPALQQVVKVTVDGQGRIVKVVASR
jgi:hypothetical protein